MAFQTTKYQPIEAFTPATADLLRQFVQYVDQIDGIEATPAELAASLIDGDIELDTETLITAALSEHERFQEWRRNRKSVLLSAGWRACAARNGRRTYVAHAV